MTTARCCGHEPSERLSFDPLDAIQIMEGVGGGRINEATLADWFRRHLEIDNVTGSTRVTRKRLDVLITAMRF